jgi:hypothetical protein
MSTATRVMAGTTRRRCQKAGLDSLAAGIDNRRVHTGFHESRLQSRGGGRVGVGCADGRHWGDNGGSSFLLLPVPV